MPPVQVRDTVQTHAEAIAARDAAIARRRAFYPVPVSVRKIAPLAPTAPEAPAPKFGSVPPLSGAVRARLDMRVIFPANVRLLDSAPPHTVKEIQLAVCQVSQTRLRDLTSQRRDSRVIGPRQVAMALARRLTGKSFPSIGASFGGRDHTTVLHAVQKLSPVTQEVEPLIASGATLWQIAAAAMESFERLRPPPPPPRRATAPRQ